MPSNVDGTTVSGSLIWPHVLYGDCTTVLEAILAPCPPMVMAPLVSGISSGPMPLCDGTTLCLESVWAPCPLGYGPTGVWKSVWPKMPLGDGNHWFWNSSGPCPLGDDHWCLESLLPMPSWCCTTGGWKSVWLHALYGDGPTGV